MRAATCSSTSRASVRAAAVQATVTPKPTSSIVEHVASVALSAAVSLTLIAGPSQAAEMRNLADVMRPVFGFVDTNKDGIISMEELQQLSTQV